MAAAILAGGTILTAAAQPDGNALAGANVTITDATASATIFGFKGNTAYFTSADGKTLGPMPVADMRALMEKVAVRDAGGSRPPGAGYGYGDWGIWFADEFNRLRSLGDGAREAVSGPERFSDEWVEAEINELIRLVNAEREKAGMHHLELCQDLMEFAMTRARELGETGLTHVRPNGERVNNEAASRGNTAEDAFAGWMNSPAHKRAILGEGGFKAWNRMGVAVYRHGAIIVFER